MTFVVVALSFDDVYSSDSYQCVGISVRYKTERARKFKRGSNFAFHKWRLLSKSDCAVLFPNTHTRKKMRREKEKKNQWQRSDYRLWLFFYDSKRWNRDQKCFSMRIRSFLWQASNVVGFLRHSFDVWWSMSSPSSSLPSISLIHVIFIAHHSPSQIGSYSISIFQPSSDTSCCVAISITLEIV